MKRIIKSRAAYIITGWLLILCTIALDTGISVPRYTLFSDKLEASLRIVLLTDFHSSSYGREQYVLTDTVAAQKPDIILMAGDIADDIREHKHTSELLKRLADTYPCFYTVGNHEEWSGECGKIKEMFRSCGVTVLSGDSRVLDINGGEIRICGIDNSMPYDQYKACTESAGDGIFTVFISHRPDPVDMYSGRDFDLVVSGHAHGGQVRIPGILNGLYAPDQGLFPEYAGGQYTLDDGRTEMIVSRGLCKNILPRVFDPPEIVVIDLYPA